MATWTRLWGAARAAGAPPFPGAPAEWSSDQVGLVRAARELDSLVEALSWRRVEVGPFLEEHLGELQTAAGVRRLLEWAMKREDQDVARAPGEYSQGWRADGLGRGRPTRP